MKAYRSDNADFQTDNDEGSRDHEDGIGGNSSSDNKKEMIHDYMDQEFDNGK